MTNVRPRRSALYLPGSNSRAIQKAASLDCDVIVFDLEDAVAPADKSTAREMACAAVQSRAFGHRELVIRINGSGTTWHQQDLHQAMLASPDAILLPKVEDDEQVKMVARELELSPCSTGIRLWCMVETPRGVLASASIAGAHQRVDCLVMGTSDLTNDIHARHTADRLPLLMSLELCLLAARAHGKLILDGVCLDLSNDDAFRSVCEQGRDLGFDGKTLIHPRQIAPCNAAFSPTDAEVEHAKATTLAYAAARAAGLGVAVLDGRLVEELHVREAERTLSLSEAIRSRLILRG